MRRCAAVLGMALAVTAQPEVTLPGFGTLAGSVKATPAGVDVDQYLGVRYAQAPLGDLRFRAPEDPSMWQGTYDAAELKSAVCPGAQCDYVGGVETEDCLFLNVYTPEGAKENPGKLPVVVWFYSGNFWHGCANEYAGEQMVASSVNKGQPVILVTLNYRIGFFGFLGSNALRGGNTSESTGNYGIQDQRKALEWVNRHISHFGGNPNRVTISGASAGASSVTMHMVSQASFNSTYTNGKLFHGAIAESGLAADFGYLPMDAAESVFGFVLMLTGCTDVPCLRALPLQVYQAILSAFSPQYFAPVIDGVELTDKPWKLLREGKFADVPVLAGTTSDEYAYFLLSDPSLLPPQATEADFDRQLSAEFGTGILPALKQQYSNESYPFPDPSTWGGHSYWWWVGMRLITDRFFFCPSRYGAHKLARGPVDTDGRRAWLPWRRAPVYQFLFTRASLSPMVHPGTGPDAFTSPHLTDLQYFFNCSVVGDCLDYHPRDQCRKVTPDPNCAFANTEEQELANKMSGVFANFVAKGQLDFPFVRTTATMDVDYMARLDAPDTSGNALEELGYVNHRKSACEFWDSVDRPEDGAATTGIHHVRASRYHRNL